MFKTCLSRFVLNMFWPPRNCCAPSVCTTRNQNYALIKRLTMFQFETMILYDFLYSILGEGLVLFELKIKLTMIMCLRYSLTSVNIGLTQSFRNLRSTALVVLLPAAVADASVRVCQRNRNRLKYC